MWLVPGPCWWPRGVSRSQAWMTRWAESLWALVAMLWGTVVSLARGVGVGPFWAGCLAETSWPDSAAQQPWTGAGQHQANPSFGPLAESMPSGLAGIPGMSSPWRGLGPAVHTPGWGQAGPLTLFCRSPGGTGPHEGSLSASLTGRAACKPGGLKRGMWGEGEAEWRFPRPTLGEGIMAQAQHWKGTAASTEVS